MDYYRGHERKLTPHRHEHHHCFASQKPSYEYNHLRNDYRNDRHYSDHYRSVGGDRHHMSDARNRHFNHDYVDVPDRYHHHSGGRRHNHHHMPRQARSPDHGYYHDAEVFGSGMRGKPNLYRNSNFWDMPLTQVYTQEEYGYNGPLFRKKVIREEHRKFRPRHVDGRFLNMKEVVIDVFVYFVYAKGCRFCRILKPYVKVLGDMYKSKINTRMIDADDNQDFVKTYNITDVPTTMIFIGDTEAYRLIKGGIDEIKRLYDIYNDLKLHH